MTEYNKTSIKLDETNYDKETGSYKGSFTGKYVGELKYGFKAYPTPKVLPSGAQIYAEFEVEGLRYPVGIFQNDKNGKIYYSGTAKDADKNTLFYVNMFKTLSANPIPSYDIVIVEPIKDEEPAKVEHIQEAPF